MKLGRPLVLFALLLAVSVCGCSAASIDASPAAGGDVAARVVVTQDFGRLLMLDEAIEVPAGTPTKEVLQQLVDLETKYGGGFVQGINGVSSGFPVKEDWFFYVNGISMNKGIADHRVFDGEVLHFDFHDWRFRMFIPAIVSGFHELCRYGHEGTRRPILVVYESGLRETAALVESALEAAGAADIDIREAADLTDAEKEVSHLVLLATVGCPLASELNRAWDRLGFFVHFEDGAMVVYDASGGRGAEYGPGSGAIQATQSPWNPGGIGVCENVVCWVAGTDEAGVRSAAEILVNGRDEYRYAYAVAVADGEVIGVPR